MSRPEPLTLEHSAAPSADSLETRLLALLGRAAVPSASCGCPSCARPQVAALKRAALEPLEPPVSPHSLPFLPREVQP